MTDEQWKRHSEQVYRAARNMRPTRDNNTDFQEQLEVAHAVQSWRDAFDQHFINFRENMKLIPEQLKGSFTPEDCVFLWEMGVGTGI